MKPFLSSRAMREADRHTIEDIGIPGFTLMESAGRAAAALLEGATGVGVVCGKGNNAGDGLVVARVLAERGVEVRVHFVAGTDALSADTERNLAILEATGNPALSLTDHLEDLAGCRLLVDAMLGTGQSAAPRPPFDSAVEWMNRQPVRRVALDVPTGLDADTGHTPGATVRADMTVSMGAVKTGMLIGNGPEVCGRIEVAEIGIPRSVLQARTDEELSGHLADDDFVRSVWPVRARLAHKYTTGPVVVIGGSAKYPGAPVLAATAAARVGSGYVAAALPEGVPWTGPAEIPVVATNEVHSWTDRARAILLGPGLGRGDAAAARVRSVLESATCPVVVDADGLRAASDLGLLQCAAVLTPHAGEFRHMTGQDIQHSVRDARTWASRWNAVLLLKGAPTVIAHPDGRVVLCTAGGASLATAGTGDVLGGLCAGLIAMGLAPFEAAVAASHAGGAAAERFSAGRGNASMMASDLVRQLPFVLSERFHL